MNLLYIAHPYEGKKENAEAVQKIVEALAEWEHPLLAEKRPEDTVHIYAAGEILEMQALDVAQAVPVSPIHQFGFMYDSVPYAVGLQKCLALLNACDVLLLCGDWRNSKGCMAEFAYAMAKGKPILFDHEGDCYELL